MKIAGLLLLFLPLSILAQNKKIAKTGWHTITSIGIVTGEANNKPVYQLSGGLVFGRYYIGIGLGYDTYQYNSFPLFADWRMGFGRRNSGFLYANGGYNVAGNIKNENEFSKTKDESKGGFYMDAGIGYRIPTGSLHRFSVSAGYSHKKIRRQKTFIYPCFAGNCPEDVYDYRYNFGRIVAKMSWELGRW